MNIGYISRNGNIKDTKEQVKTLEIIPIEKWFSDDLDQEETNRPGFYDMLASIDKDNVVYIERFSRIAKSTSDLKLIIDRIMNSQLHLVSIRDDFDTRTESGLIKLDMLHVISNFEKETARQQQSIGIEKAKLLGKYKGHPKPIENIDYYYGKWINNETTINEVAYELNLHRNTVSKYFKEYRDKLNESN